MRNNTVRLEELMPLIRERLAAGESVRFSPHGTSMLPMLKDGRDQVILSPLPEKLKKYDLPLYQRKNGQYHGCSTQQCRQPLKYCFLHNAYPLFVTAW